MTDRLRYLLALLLVVLLAACRREEPPAPTTEIIREVPAPLAAVEGKVTVPQPLTPGGVMVYAEGTSYIAMTDGDGRFVLSNLPKGTYRLAAARADLETKYFDAVSIHEADLAAKQPCRTLPQLVLQTSSNPVGIAATWGSLRGTVVTTFPGDSAGVVVSLPEIHQRTETAADGSFFLANIPAGEYRIEVLRTGYRFSVVTARVEIGKEAVLDPVHLEADGDRQDSRRTVVGNVRVRPERGTAAPDITQVVVTLDGSSFRATPDTAGNFQIDDVAPGQYSVSAVLPGYLTQGHVAIDLTEITDVRVDLVLVPDPAMEQQTGSVSGTATLSDKPESSSGITIALAGTSSMATTDASGSFRLLDVPAGSYDLVASHPGYETMTLEGLEVRPGANFELDPISLEPAAIAPTVVYTTPGDGEQKIAINDPTPLVIHFSTKMDPASVKDAFHITPEVDYDLYMPEGKGAAAPDTLYVELAGYSDAPKARVLKFRQRYTVMMASSAADERGTPMKDDFKFSFTMDDARIIATFPEDGARGVFVNFNQPIKISLNAQIVHEGVTMDDFDFSPKLHSNPTVQIRNNPRNGWSTIYLDAATDSDTRYTVRVKSGALKTIGGSRVSGLPYTFSFTTSKPRDYMPNDSNQDRRQRRDEEKQRR